MTNGKSELYVEFSAVGDITLGDHPLCVGFGAYSKFKNLPSIYPFEYVLDQFKKADILFGNLECALSKNEIRKNDYNFSQMLGHYKNIKGLSEAGFKVLNLANNHSMQHGREIFQETLELLEEHRINYCGVNLDNHKIGKPVIVEIKGVRIVFLGYSLRPRQYFESNPLYTEGNIIGIERDIKRVRQKVDIVIISLHWGDEFVEQPSPEEIKTARGIIDAGADLIIGHHPHVLRGIEKYKHGIVVYSLGNFVCDMAWDKRLRESLIFNCHITKQGIRNIELTPIYINDDYQPIVIDDGKGEAFLSRIGKLSKELNEETLSDIIEKKQDYELKANEILKEYRKESQMFFLRHVHRYPFSILFQQILSYLNHRIREFVGRNASC